MKKLKISMLAIIFTVGVGGAVVQKLHAAPKKQDPTYNWQQTNAAGNIVLNGQYDAGVSQVQAETDFGCSGSADPCATTVSSKNGSKTNQGTILHN
ncbi:MAG: hypothetical protein ABI203_07360 [Mucilaginibacter sp.]